MKGVVDWKGGSDIIFKKAHLVEITLDNGYPLHSLAGISFKSPILHPNVYSHGLVCIGWYDPASPLSAILIIIARLINYEIYDFHLTSNNHAIKFCKSMKHIFPIQDMGLNQLHKYMLTQRSSGFAGSPLRSDPANR
ncbi:MAG: hypothetical protein OMM_11426 [Candidatus Magnetoglobus multicellularis str. Araruama]|uniref:UBC core domain-containing protein n=1 Tax=Candidatus Magnetoglobus multicellularis str. Araruama TaxID=890399 RepID=A0A1V1NYF4_9BACT|nr:MAG: hypothetical protein OMM_11426 [Candidatus Magnetoglobus multicellularis str. Araruama]